MIGMVVVKRGSNAHVAIADQWNEIVTIHNWASISTTVSSKVITVTNNSSGYVNALVFAD